MYVAEKWGDKKTTIKIKRQQIESEARQRQVDRLPQTENHFNAKDISDISWTR